MGVAATRVGLYRLGVHLRLHLRNVFERCGKKKGAEWQNRRRPSYEDLNVSSADLETVERGICFPIPVGREHLLPKGGREGRPEML